MAADLVIKNGWVVTPEETFKGGVAISNEKFVAIGADDQLPKAKRRSTRKVNIFSPVSSTDTSILESPA